VKLWIKLNSHSVSSRSRVLRAW